MHIQPKTIHMLAFVVFGSALAGCGAEAQDDGDDLGVAEQPMSDDACPDGVPAALKPAADQKLAFVFHAVGTQNYTCAATATGFAWTFVAPAADLYKDNGHLVGSHYVGPTWEFQDGSTAHGVKLAGAAVDPTSIPWLLLKVDSHGPVEGKMTEVTSIQRLSTVGGPAPATGCDADHVGAGAEVPYTADYFFYKTDDGDHNAQCGD